MSPEKSQRDSNIPADLQPYYDRPQNGGRAWARWLTRILAVIILIILIGLFVRWAWDQTHDDDKAKSGTTTSQGTKTKSFGSTDTGSDSSTAGDTATDTPTTATPSTTPAPAASTGGSAASAAQTAGQSSTLTNTGPGETVAIFVTASAVFAIGYQLRLRKQA